MARRTILRKNFKSMVDPWTAHELGWVKVWQPMGWLFLAQPDPFEALYSTAKFLVDGQNLRHIFEVSFERKHSESEGIED